LRTLICLGLDDATDKSSAPIRAHQVLADQLACNDQRALGVELTLQLTRTTGGHGYLAAIKSLEFGKHAPYVYEQISLQRLAAAIELTNDPTSVLYAANFLHAANLMPNLKRAVEEFEMASAMGSAPASIQV